MRTRKTPASRPDKHAPIPTNIRLGRRVQCAKALEGEAKNLAEDWSRKGITRQKADEIDAQRIALGLKPLFRD